VHPLLLLIPPLKCNCPLHCTSWFANDLSYSLASVAGTQEPIYGPEAIQPVSRQQTEDAPYTELTKDHLRWRAYQYTNVETQTYYVMADNGTLVMVQIIYSNIA
jgi:hypothetical protein